MVVDIKKLQRSREILINFHIQHLDVLYIKCLVKHVLEGFKIILFLSKWLCAMKCICLKDKQEPPINETQQ